MKYLLLFLSLSLLSCKTTVVPKEYFKQELIVEDLKETREESYIKANTWMLDVFRSSASVVEFTDKESGTILGKYIIQGSHTAEFGYTVDYRVFAKIDIRIKDNAAKILIIPDTNISITNNKEIEDLHKKIKSLIDSFENYMKNEKSDW